MRVTVWQLLLSSIVLIQAMPCEHHKCKQITGRDAAPKVPDINVDSPKISIDSPNDPDRIPDIMSVGTGVSGPSQSLTRMPEITGTSVENTIPATTKAPSPSVSLAPTSKPVPTTVHTASSSLPTSVSAPSTKTQTSQLEPATRSKSSKSESKPKPSSSAKATSSGRTRSSAATTPSASAAPGSSSCTLGGISKRSPSCDPLENGGLFNENYGGTSYVGRQEDVSTDVDNDKLMSLAEQTYKDFKTVQKSRTDPIVLTGAIKMPGVGYVFASKPRAGLSGPNQKDANAVLLDILEDAKQYYPQWLKKVWNPRTQNNRLKNPQKGRLEMIHVEDMLVIQGMKYYREANKIPNGGEVDVPRDTTGSVYGRPVSRYDRPIKIIPCNDVAALDPPCKTACEGIIKWMPGTLTEAREKRPPAEEAGPSNPKKPKQGSSEPSKTDTSAKKEQDTK